MKTSGVGPGYAAVAECHAAKCHAAVDDASRSADERAGAMIRRIVEAAGELRVNQ